MTDRKTAPKLLKSINIILRTCKFQKNIYNICYRLPAIVQPLYSGLKPLLLVALFTATISTSLAQEDYGTGNSGGAVTFHGKHGNYGEFSIATFPAASKNKMPEGKYYTRVSKSFEMPQTNLEYYPGAEKIAIDFGFDTSFVKVNDMRYSIITGDSSVLIRWSPLPKGRWVPQGGSRTVLFLNELDCKNKVIFIKLYNINNPESVITQIVNTKKLEPPRLFGFAVYLQSDNKAKKAPPAGKQDMASKYKALVLDGTVINADQELNGLGISIPTDVPYFFRAYIIRDIKGKADTIDLPSNWVKMDSQYRNHLARMSSDINWNKLADPGYSLSIPGDVVKNEGRYKVFVTNADYRKGWRSLRTIQPLITSNSLSFTVQQPRSFTSSDVLFIVGIVILPALGYFLILKQRQRSRLRKEQQTTKEARLSLQAVQSQLNPHFIFNALSGIQNLMNKQENEKANAYLTTFSKLTRMVLNDAHKDLIPLKDETELLHYYLQMEQLRFGFSYQILAAPDIDSQNTEIPPMLLQPFVENAVKHGIASLKEAGVIQVNIRREHNDILIEIRDNGKGFNPGLSYSGKGLGLSGSRLSLLNTIYGPVFELDISSAVSATFVLLKIKNWLT